MSRKISIQEKKKWLEMFENGQTENQIAKQLKRDLRTIVNGIQEASRDRHLANAEADMLRSALLAHQNKLIEVVNRIAGMLVMPEVPLTLHEDQKGIISPIPLKHALLEQDDEARLVLKLNDEEKLEWELLQEHLKSDKLWIYIKRWRQAIEQYANALTKYKQFIKSVLEKGTGLKIEGQNGSKINFISSNTVELFYEVSIRTILGIKEGLDLEHTIVPDDNGNVKRGASVLAHCDDANECSKKVTSVYISLPKSDEARDIERYWDELAAITRTARRQADEIMLLGMVMGKCRVCARLGK